MFLYNPFGREIIETVIQHLLAANPPELYVLYGAPDLSVEQFGLECINAFEGERSKQRFEVWMRVNARER